MIGTPSSKPKRNAKLHTYTWYNSRMRCLPFITSRLLGSQHPSWVFTFHDAHVPQDFQSESRLNTPERVLSLSMSMLHHRRPHKHAQEAGDGAESGANNKHRPRQPSTCTKRSNRKRIKRKRSLFRAHNITRCRELKEVALGHAT